jgi:predicted  nucleic acid-binding Zn-ribbon protein
MPDDPITLATLTQFHREVLLPDMQRIVDGSVQRVEARLRDEMHAGFDAVYQRLDRLETEYHMLVAGLKRVEERLGRVEGRLERVEGRLDALEQQMSAVEQKLEKMALRSELEELKARVEGLQGQIRALEERLSA